MADYRSMRQQIEEMRVEREAWMQRMEQLDFRQDRQYQPSSPLGILHGWWRRFWVMLRNNLTG